MKTLQSFVRVPTVELSGHMKNDVAIISFIFMVSFRKILSKIKQFAVCETRPSTRWWESPCIGAHLHREKFAKLKK